MIVVDQMPRQLKLGLRYRIDLIYLERHKLQLGAISLGQPRNLDCIY